MRRCVIVDLYSSILPDPAFPNKPLTRSDILCKIKKFPDFLLREKVGIPFNIFIVFTKIGASGKGNFFLVPLKIIVAFIFLFYFYDILILAKSVTIIKRENIICSDEWGKKLSQTN